MVGLGGSMSGIEGIVNEQGGDPRNGATLTQGFISRMVNLVPLG